MHARERYVLTVGVDPVSSSRRLFCWYRMLLVCSCVPAWCLHPSWGRSEGAVLHTTSVEAGEHPYLTCDGHPLFERVSAASQPTVVPMHTVNASKPQQQRLCTSHKPFHVHMRSGPLHVSRTGRQLVKTTTANVDKPQRRRCSVTATIPQTSVRDVYPCSCVCSPPAAATTTLSGMTVDSACVLLVSPVVG